jgi:hypothetical protein
MKRRARIVSLFTALAVAWMALWPLVSAARVVAGGEAMPLCHQAGLLVQPGEMPLQPGEPGKARQHCPLCVMAFLAAFEPPAVVAARASLEHHAFTQPHCAALPGAIEVQIPQGRAPPALS